MKTFKELKEELSAGPTNVTAGVSVGPNDIGVKLDSKKKKFPPEQVLTIKPLTRKM